jgi:hypothetical protein
VVFIDDELDSSQSTASALLGEIRATGRPVSTALSVPNDPEAWFEHWQSLAFVVLDWDLSPGSSGREGGSTLSHFERQKLFAFLDSLMKRIFCPIFVISAEDTGDIRRQLQEHSEFLNASGELDARIAVFPKDVLMERIVHHLEGWVAGSPAMSALKAWEREHDAAKNRLFIDLNATDAAWPVYVWRSANDDEIDPAYELASVISSNLLNRINPVSFDVNAISSYSGQISGASMRKVFQGRTVVDGSRLSERMVFPGDLFRLTDAVEPEVWMNVSPVCQTVGRAQAPRLHLLRGTPQPTPTSKGKFTELDRLGKGPNKVLIHTLLNETPYLFSFGEAQIVEWEAVKEQRVGRLLPPFITRVQQMHAAYIQSEGLPKVTPAFYDINP